MSHLSEGALLALRDGGLGLVDVAERDHLASCETCAAALVGTEARSERLERALGALDRDFELERARVEVRRRIDEVRSRPARLRGTGWHLGRAAAVLLVLAGGAAALPGSPVRSWLFEREAPVPEEAPAGAVEALEAPEATSVRVVAGDGPVLVTLTGATAGSVIEVRWAPAGEVGVTAPAGTTFATGEGRITARVAPGDVRVDLPRAGVASSLVVDGRTYLSSSADGIELGGPVESRSEGLLRFRVPAG